MPGALPSFPPSDWLNPSRWPRILAGPILRKVTTNLVSIWVATKEDTPVAVRIYELRDAQETSDPESTLNGPELASDDRGGLIEIARTDTENLLQLGEHLFVGMLIVQPAQPLKPGKLYAYDLVFEDNKSLLNDGQLLLDSVSLAYDSEGALRLPTFCLPGSTLGDLRVLHGSCRKAHGGGIGGRSDALASIQSMMTEAVGGTGRKVWQHPDRRPQQLLLTGDQIYADDVADALLMIVQQLAPVLFGDKFVEQLPACADPELMPGMRARLVRSYGVSSESPYCKSHLITFREFVCVYLLSWSQALWPMQASSDTNTRALVLPPRGAWYNSPMGKRLSRSTWFMSSPEDGYEFHLAMDLSERAALQRFWKTLRVVQQSLANVSTYMSFDDHEVTDDWSLTKAWCERFYPSGSPENLGWRIFTNALSTYAVFQAQGNDPLRWRDGQKEKALIQDLASLGSTPENGAARASLAKRLGAPLGSNSGSDNGLEGGLWRSSTAVDWHFSEGWECHELLSLDTRTWREFPNGPDGAPCLIALDHLHRQVPSSGRSSKVKVTFLIAPPPWFGVPALEWAQERVLVPATDLLELGVPTRQQLQRQIHLAPTFGIDNSELERMAGRNWPQLRETFFTAAKLASGEGHSRWDLEAPAFNPTGFESLVRALGERCSTREQPGSVLVLSGDVHYAFTTLTKVQFQRLPSLGSPRPATVPSSWRNLAIGQLVSSSLHNEGSDTALLESISHLVAPLAAETELGDLSTRRVTVVCVNSQGEALTVYRLDPWPLPFLPIPNWDWYHEMVIVPSGNPHRLANVLTARDKISALNWYLNEVSTDVRAMYSDILDTVRAFTVSGRNNLGDVSLDTREGQIRAIHRIWSSASAGFRVFRQWELVLAGPDVYTSLPTPQQVTGGGR